ncbi:hypothetical protein G7Y89_g10431 [Cudoniella acicularis]|uniref:Uncharacterized protein n=1 Tax=Cudoniella acicularis TaxID=354080 RepID=A0A8H4RF35_9HELO|nr:hypothetical protein G7Y89_g10431 [Cudoniella acicularis]
MAAPIQLAPIYPPLGVNPAYCVPKQTTLVMKEKVFSLAGDTFHIVDENGVEVLQCRGQVFSISDRKEFTDTSGRPLFSLRSKLLSLRRSFYAEAPNGSVLFEVKGKFTFGGAKMIATFNNASNSAPIELVVKGNWFDRSATIMMGDILVAQISRQFLNMRQILGGAQTYYVTVAPGADLAMIAAICVCLDEKRKRQVIGISRTSKHRILEYTLRRPLVF